MPNWSGSGRDKTQKAKAKGPAWQGTAGGGAGARSSAQWKTTKGPAKDPEARSRAVRTFFVAVALLLLAGFIYLVITRPEPTPLISLRASAYPLQMPPLAFAEEDVELLTRASPSNVRVTPVKLESSDSLRELRSQLEKAGRRFNYFRRGNEVLLIHIAAHGMANDAGSPCLIPSLADPFDAQTWLPLDNILALIRDEGSLQGKKKLVLLDCQRVFSCWRCGWLESRFHSNGRFDDNLAAAVTAANDPDLFVLTSADAGQINWAAPELRSSVFAHFVARALRGEAADSRNVSLLDFCRFVATGVDAYSRQRRDSRQQPVLFHRDHAYHFDHAGKLVDANSQPAKIETFSLAYIDRWRSRQDLTEIRSSFDPLADAKRLLGLATTDGAHASESKHQFAQLWQTYQQRRQPPQGNNQSLAAYTLDPVAWSSIQQRMAAIGERLFAGHEYQGAALQNEMERLAKDLNNDDVWRPRGTRVRLSASPAGGSESTATNNGPGSGENVFHLYLKTEADKRDEVLPKRLPATRLVNDIYTAIGENSAPADARLSLEKALQLIDRYSQTGEPSLVEQQFLKLLDRGSLRNQPIPGNHLAAALKARQSAERAADSTDLRVHYAIEPIVNAADDKRREAEDLFFLGSEPRRSENLWKESASAPPGAGYAAAIAHHNCLAECLQLRDEIWAELPFIAQWCASAGAAGASVTPAQLMTVLQSAIDLDDFVQRAIQSRDEPDTLATRLERCQQILERLHRDWDAAHADLARIYDRPTNTEQAYRRGKHVRAAEIALRYPPLADSSTRFVGLYLETLAEWTSASLSVQNKPSDDSARSSNADPSGSEAAAANPLFDAFLRELHRAMAYEFVGPYEQHRHIEQWEGKPLPDRIFRSGGSDAAWSKIRKLLDSYDEAIARELPSWSQSQSALAASTKLRQWDRRVRVASPWLSSFQRDLKRPTQPTPARWLQEFDAAHWTAWQAYRAKCDFWGNGQPPGEFNSPPYFAAAIDQCEAALPESLRPIRYDIPGDGIADFSERSAAALASLSRWQPIAMPPSQRTGAGNKNELKIELALQPPADSNQFRLPAGVATLSFRSPEGNSSGADPVTGSFDLAGQQNTSPVALPLAGKQAATIAAYVHLPAEASPTASELDARFWYRGHVRLKPCPLPGSSGSDFVAYEFVRPDYPAPTVEVRGKDVIRGAVLFVFDCSASMRTPDKRFEDAKTSLATVLNELDRDAGSSLRVGLMAYGRQTPADYDSQKFYDFRSSPNSPILTEFGQKARQSWRDAIPFEVRYPHPDRDVKVYAPVATSSALDAKKQLDRFAMEDCRGCTPLYYSVQQALDGGFTDLPRNLAGVRQVVVISDGVNMPYESYDGRIGRAVGATVNDADYKALESALARHTADTQVLVVLFGVSNPTPTERQQLAALNTLATEHSNFRIIQINTATEINRAIYAALPKTTIELRGGSAETSIQKMEFNKPQTPREWPSDGLLRRELAHQVLRLTHAGENRSIDKEFDLLGGERVILQYEPRDGQLLFLDDMLTCRTSSPLQLQPPRPSDNRRLLLDALDPERVGLTVSKLHFRLRDEDSSRRFTPRPQYVWLEVTPLLAGGAPGDRTFPCIDVAWKANTNLPRLQMPVESWPECPSARARAWFRYDDPLALAQATIPRDRDSQLLTVGQEKWQIDQSTGEGSSQRKITVTWAPADSASGLQTLLDRAVWLSPPPDAIRRQYAIDGSAATHEFTYNRPDVGKVDLRIVSRSQFVEGAYFADLQFDVSN